ncbi:peptidoglycan recognition protein family protein [Streptomonospora sp. S1-112]|uniref:Peptidoglycan recognition protein family protein n=1 Tax=Streptomonospora mangrovi TaxID=2883123 RepID=A0A9X3NGD7_9ACTN|nr:peptidoglycan recognition family protein [Streptomonospora mangrovi]MDA0562982.1 peptidoglycan recognition protein family protein [Streptomonospora mangrovi]
MTEVPMDHSLTPQGDAAGTAGPADLSRRRAVLLGGAIAAGAVLGAAGLGVSPAFAAEKPYVYSRASWNARKPVLYAKVLDRAPTYVIVHHTATPNSTDYSREHAFALSRSIQNHHMDNNGWDDIGQQLTISRGGYIMEGRNRSLVAIRDGNHAVGAHVESYNDVAIGIENEGTYISASPTGALWESLVATCAWLCSAYGRPVSAIRGHRDFNATVCPGDRLYSMLPRLREEVGARLAAAGLQTLSTEELPARQRPPFPEVPTSRATPEPFDHGPAVGAGDSNRHER